MTAFTLGLLALFAASSAQAQVQTFDVEGFVVDRNDEPVAGAIVSLEGLEIATSTDSLGNFVLPGVPKGEHRVTARMGCVMTGHIDGLRIPRPVRVPLPIRMSSIDCGADHSLSLEEEQALIAEAVRAFADETRRPIVHALIADGAIRLLNGGNVSARNVAIEGHPVPVEHLAQDATFPEAIWLSLCFSTPRPRTALVRVVRASPPVPEELDVFAGDAALLVFTRVKGDPTWRLARQLVCLDAEPGGGRGAGPGQGRDEGEASDGVWIETRD